jgi:hypothetical protein
MGSCAFASHTVFHFNVIRDGTRVLSGLAKAQSHDENLVWVIL